MDIDNSSSNSNYNDESNNDVPNNDVSNNDVSNNDVSNNDVLKFEQNYSKDKNLIQSDDFITIKKLPEKIQKNIDSFEGNFLIDDVNQLNTKSIKSKINIVQDDDIQIDFNIDSFQIIN